ncbi:MAG: ABC transporter ATP-binding protein [Limisphaerales bacterium]
MKRAILEVQDLCARRGKTELLKNISWRVMRGEHWVVLGANGSGKTSLLSVLSGYLTASAGEIEVLGERYGESDWTVLRRKIGIVSSSVRQMMADVEPAILTVASGKFAMIDFWGDPGKSDLDEARTILEQVECSYLADRPWGVLSQGERQRILIARALMAAPELLILDEPCAGLDPVARENFLQFVERLGRQGNAPALILVTHHVEEICPIFSHALLLREGEVLASGPIKTVLNSAGLSKTFGAPVKLVKRGKLFQLQVRSQKKVII